MTSIKKDFSVTKGIRVQTSIKIGDAPAKNSLLDSATVTQFVQKPEIASSITAVAGLISKVYDSADLLPLSGNAAGDFGFVNSTNRLYLWNGSGWYNIALINTTPTLSTTPDSNYSMDSVGASLSITILAADPEEVPIAYSYLSDSASNFVTITQDSSVFTISPLTQAQLDSNGVGSGGTFTITFRASDGVNIAPAVSSFTLTIPVKIYDWTQGSQQAKINATSGAANEYYGWDVAIDEDGNTAIASVPFGNTTVAGQGEVFVYTLGSAYDWNNNSATSTTHNYGQYGGDDIGVFDFSSDGSYVFAYTRGPSGGVHQHRVYRYPLSTAFDVTTASSPGAHYLDVAGQSTDGSGTAAATDGYAMKIGKNGTRLYIVDHGDNVFQWNLSTANDLTSASYGTSFDVSTQATDPSGIEFNSDGTKMYVGDEQDRTIYEYNLSTAWEVNTATYSQSRSFATAGSGGDQASNTNLVVTQRGIAFNNDGTRIYIVCDTNNVVFRFNLSTAYDITTAVYNKRDGSNVLIGYIALNSTTHFDLKWNLDGSKMYVGQPTADVIRQYATPAQWSEQQILNLNSTGNSYFGWSADIASDGDTIVAGAVSDNAGSGGRLGVFNRDSAGGTWTLQQSLSASDAADGDFLGEGCAISGDGNTIIGGAARKGSGTTRGAAYIFTKGDDSAGGLGPWSQQAKITPATAAVGSGSADFGKAVTITNNGNVVAIGAPGSTIASGSIQGHVEVYTRSGSTWTHLQSITQSSPSNKDGFGWTVSLSGNDGYTLAIGQHYETTNDEGNCWIFTRDSDNGTFSEQKALRPAVTNTEDFGINVSLSDDANTVLAGAQTDDTGGTAFVFRRSSNQDSDWTEKKKLAASDAGGDDYFGYAVSLSGDGSSAIVGAWAEDTNGSQSGSAYIFKAPDSA